MFPFATAARPAAPAAAFEDGSTLLARAPGLREGADRLLESLVKSLRTMAGEATSVGGAVASIAAVPMRDVIAAHGPESVAAKITAAGLSCTMLLTLDPTLIYAIVELLTGGDGTEQIPTAARAATTIDQHYSQTIVSLVSTAIEAEWASNGFGSMRPARLDGSIPPDVCGPRISEVAVVTFTIEIFDLAGAINLILPPAALGAFPQVDTDGLEPGASSDPEWNDLLKREVGRAPVNIEAYLEGKEVSLGMIARLELGQIIELVPMARSRATLVCDGRTLYRGELGQHDSKFSLRIEEIVASQTTRNALLRDENRKSSELAKAS